MNTGNRIEPLDTHTLIQNEELPMNNTKNHRNIVAAILPHIVIVLAAMFITFWILDQLNPIMNFINNTISNLLLITFSITALINSIFSIAWYRRSRR
ncbi:hypothetical protein [Anaerosporobacter faecicola]|uniref:hypothetical protein n=1 Tax=Anaerosporobacter faecicola TaxID=2718714 RepID=UPI00143A0EF3|nr:hypothetical protein [Anaerosporobacter faecicola]